jgi:hypothetical protein
MSAASLDGAVARRRTVGECRLLVRSAPDAPGMKSGGEGARAGLGPIALSSMNRSSEWA